MDEDESEGTNSSEPSNNGAKNVIANTRAIQKRSRFNQSGTKVTCCTFHPSRTFWPLDIPRVSSDSRRCLDFPTCTLGFPEESITSVVINASGKWLTFGASRLGQTLAWE